MMLSRKQRNVSRYELNYPILLIKQTLPSRRAHLAQILDVGVGGMRLLVTDPASLPIGGELKLSLSPAHDQKVDALALYQKLV